MDYTVEINGHILEHIDDGHIYLCDGVIVPSITQILKVKFKNKYANVSDATLQRASALGTAVHDAIEQYCVNGTESDLKEVQNFKFLQKQYNFRVLENEAPVILFDGNKPIAAGRLDLILAMEGKIIGADIKRTSTLDKEYLAYQLNLYRIAYRQCYGVEWDELRGVHLREDIRKFVLIPINEDMAWQLVREYQECNGENDE